VINLLKFYAATSLKQGDCVISDIRMPNIDGFELLKIIRENYSYVPYVFFMSGYSPYKEEDLLHEGAAGFLPKPIDFDKLFFMIMERFVESPYDGNRLYRTKTDIEAKTKTNLNLVVKDIGYGGAFLNVNSETMEEHSHAFAQGNAIEFTFHLDDNPIKIKGVVVWVRHKNSYMYSSGMGVRFTSMEQSIREKIEEFVRRKKIISFIPSGKVEFGTP